MFARVRSATVLGVEAYIVEVEVDLDYKLPSFTTVGLAEGAVKESKERVSSAIKNSGYFLPQKRVTINLAPADRKKEALSIENAISYYTVCIDCIIDPHCAKINTEKRSSDENLLKWLK